MTLTPEENKIITQYIQKLSDLGEDHAELQAVEEQAQFLSQAQLEALALESGISSEVLEQARATADAQVQDGIKQRQLSQWNGAIASFKHSLELRPKHPDTLYQLALTYFERYQQHHRAGDRQQALHYSQRCLALQPDYPLAQTLVHSLDESPTGTADALTDALLASTPSPTSRPLSEWMAIGLVAIAGVGSVVAGLLLFNGQETARHTADSPEVSVTVPASPEPSDREAPTPPPTPATATSSAVAVPEMEIPVVLDDSVTNAGMAIAVRRSRLNNYPESSFHTLQALVVNQSDLEWRKINLLTEWLDAEGQVLQQKTVQALDTYQPVLRPGDQFPVSQLQESSPLLAQVRMSVQVMDTVPGAAQYAPGNTVPLQWSVAQPSSQWQLAVEERSWSLTPRSFDDTDHLDATFAVTNQGDVTIDTLKIELQLYDAAGNIMERKPLLVAYGNAPELLAGETRLVRAIASMEPGVERYELAVVEAK